MIEAHLEVLAQASSYLMEVGTPRYVQVLSPRFMSSAGSHMRHILDHYTALRAGLQCGEVDYTVRSRGSAIESDPVAALARLDAIEAWLTHLPDAQLREPLSLRTEVSVSRREVANVPTTLARELVFAASHAVHHFAMIGQIASQQGQVLARGFGVAPATASHLRATGAAVRQTRV